MAKFEVAASTIVETDDATDALVKGIKIFKNVDIESICDMSKIKLNVKRID